MSGTIAIPTKSDRETLHAKIRFLSVITGEASRLMEDRVFDGKDLYAISVFLGDIANEVYPEYSANKEGIA